MNLTKHFTLEELTTTGKHQNTQNTLPYQYFKNIQKLANKLEHARAIWDDVTVVVTYGFRGLELNKACGGSSNSAHCEASAADVVPSQWQLKAAWWALVADKEFMSDIDQLILERGCIHIGLPTSLHHYVARHELRTDMDINGKRVYPLYGIWTPEGICDENG